MSSIDAPEPTHAEDEETPKPESGDTKDPDHTETSISGTSEATNTIRPSLDNSENHESPNLTQLKSLCSDKSVTDSSTPIDQHKKPIVNEESGSGDMASNMDTTVPSTEESGSTSLLDDCSEGTSPSSPCSRRLLGNGDGTNVMASGESDEMSSSKPIDNIALVAPNNECSSMEHIKAEQLTSSESSSVDSKVADGCNSSISTILDDDIDGSNSLYKTTSASPGAEVNISKESQGSTLILEHDDEVGPDQLSSADQDKTKHDEVPTHSNDISNVVTTTVEKICDDVAKDADNVTNEDSDEIANSIDNPVMTKTDIDIGVNEANNLSNTYDEFTNKTEKSKVKTAVSSENNTESDVCVMDTDITDSKNSTIANSDEKIQEIKTSEMEIQFTVGDPEMDVDNVKGEPCVVPPIVEDSATDQDIIQDDDKCKPEEIQPIVQDATRDLDKDVEVLTNKKQKDPSDSIKDAEMATIDKIDNSAINESSTAENKEIQPGNDESDSVKTQGHGLTKPNMMIEIPSQELIDIDESLNLSNDNSVNDNTVKEVTLESDTNLDNEFDDDDAESDDDVLEHLTDILESISETAKDVKTISETNKQSLSVLQALPTTSINKTDHTENLCRKDEKISSEETEDLKETITPPTSSKKELSTLAKDPNLLSKETVTPLDTDVEMQCKDAIAFESRSSETEIERKTSVIPTDQELPYASPKHLETTSVKVLKTSKPAFDHDKPSTSTKELDQPPTSTTDPKLRSPASKEAVNPPQDLDDIEAFIKEVEPLQPTPFLGEMDRDADSSNEVPVVTDSLGLLAESSSRVVGDDVDADDPDTPEEDDDDDEADPDYDESSNQAEQSEDHSEDSNMAHLELEMPVMTSVYTTDDTSDCLEKENDKEIDEEIQDDANGETAMGVITLTDVTVTDTAENEVVEKDGDIELNIDNELDAEEAEPLPEVSELPDDADVIPLEITEVISAAEVTATEAEKEVTNDAEVPTASAVSPKPVEKSEIQTEGILATLLMRKSGTEDMEVSPTKKTLAISKPKHVVNIVDLEESSEDDVVDTTEAPVAPARDEVTSVNIPTGIEIMSSGEVISEITTSKGEIIISGVPKPPAQKMSRLNTGEITIKTGSSADSMVIPETKMGESSVAPSVRVKTYVLEVFNLDSDEDDLTRASSKKITKTKQQDSVPQHCVNRLCRTGRDVTYYPASQAVLAHFDSSKKRGMVCEYCFGEVVDRTESLIEDMKKLKPLLEMNMKVVRPELVEISDSDSDDELDPKCDGGEKIGMEAALKLEKELALMINETWVKYDMDTRLHDAEDEIRREMKRLDKENAQIHRMLNECQAATDKLRGELYDTFEPLKEKVPPVVIYDTPDITTMYEEVDEIKMPGPYATRQKSKRRLSSVTELPSKRQAVPTMTTEQYKTGPVADNTSTQPPDFNNMISKPAEPAAMDTSKVDDDKEDVSVVRLCAETAPSSLPPLGLLQRAPLTAGLTVFAMRNAFGSWIRARVMEVTPKGTAPQASLFSMVRVKFDSKNTKTPYKVLPARCIAYDEPATVRMTIGTRCIALFKDSANMNKRESYYSGVVAEVPNPVNNFRYLVFFDDGYAQYVQHHDTRLVAESSSLVWEEVHPFSREFVRQYLLAYPERPMVRLHTGQNIKTEWNGKWWITRVLKVDASLVQVHFSEDDRTEWIYRGSTRLAPLFLELQAAERTRSRPMPRNRQARAVNMPYVEYTRSDEQEASRADAERARIHRQRMEHDIRRQRAVAKKSTAPAAPPPPHPAAPHDTVTSRVVYYTPKSAVKPYKYTPHVCSPRCKRSGLLALTDLRTYNPLAKPILSGWERQVVRMKGHKEVMYLAPCGRRLRDIRDVHRYLRATRSDMAVDLFDFSPTTHCLAEFVLNKCIVGKKDLSHGKENVPVPCVNYYDDSLPEFCSYNTERTPTAGVPLNLDPDFLCGCDCTDDCQDKSKCACWQMTLEGARTIGMDEDSVGYKYKRLLEPLPSGIYECNSRCKCKHTCLNRVAQHPLQLKLQVFKTLNRGWGIRALNDVPKGAFLCVYAGNLLTDATANLDGLNEGDEYLAELDYIEVVEQMKEGYEEDIPEKDKKLDKKESGQESSSDELSSSSDEDQPSKTEQEDNDFQPGYIPQPTKDDTVFSKRLRKRDKVKKEKDNNKGDQKKDEKVDKDDEECITISDDEELREPSRFMAEAVMNELTPVSKHRSVRCLYGKDEACYIMDAKVQGNIGRYLNHSCSPNVFVQNVFVDTHDPRFPWVAFFALSHIKAGTELTWNYNYDIGSVPGKTLYCYCSAPNCRGRLL